MTWIAQEHRWVATPEDIVTTLSNDGFEECKREMTTSRRDLRPAGGVWQGVNPRTGSVASDRSEEHTSELQSRLHLVCRLLLEKKKKNTQLLNRYDNERTNA